MQMNMNQVSKYVYQFVLAEPFIDLIDNVDNIRLMKTDKLLSYLWSGLVMNDEMKRCYMLYYLRQGAMYFKARKVQQKDLIRCSIPHSSLFVNFVNGNW